VSYDELRTWAEQYFDAQQARISAENKIRSQSVDDEPLQEIVEHYHGLEKFIEKHLKKSYQATASPGVIAWQKAEAGIGDKLLARLLGQIGDPRIASPMHWEGTGSKRILVADEPFKRSVSQLWSYCGHGDPTRRRRKGMSADEAMAMGNPQAKMIVHLLAESCLKSGVRTNEDGTKYSVSHYGQVYLDARDRYADALHTAECPRCGPSGKPALTGSPLPPAHQHARALRLLGKTILRDLWVAADDNLGGHGSIDAHTRPVPDTSADTVQWTSAAHSRGDSVS
jgi:hypothetical protein